MYEDNDKKGREEANEEENYAYTVLTESGKSKNIGMTVAALVLGIVSVFGAVSGWVGMICGILAIVFSVIGRVKLGYFNGYAIAGLILGIFGTVLGIAQILFEIFLPYIIEYLENNYGFDFGDYGTEQPVPDINGGI